MKVLIVCLMIILFALGLTSAAPRQFPMKFPLGKPRNLLGDEQNGKTAMNQVLPALAPLLASQLLPLGATVGKKAVQYVVCDRNTQLQEYADNEEIDAQIMALVKVMNDLLAAQEKVNKVKKLNTKDNRIAEAELFDSVSDALGGALDFAGGVAKGVICSDSGRY